MSTMKYAIYSPTEFLMSQSGEGSEFDPASIRSKNFKERIEKKRKDGQ